MELSLHGPVLKNQSAITIFIVELSQGRIIIEDKREENCSFMSQFSSLYMCPLIAHFAYIRAAIRG